MRMVWRELHGTADDVAASAVSSWCELQPTQASVQRADGQDALSPQALRSAYRELARQYHPDMVPPSERGAAEERMKRLNQRFGELRAAMMRESGSAAYGAG